MQCQAIFDNDKSQAMPSKVKKYRALQGSCVSINSYQTMKAMSGDARQAIRGNTTQQKCSMPFFNARVRHSHRARQCWAMLRNVRQ